MTIIEDPRRLLTRPVDVHRLWRERTTVPLTAPHRARDAARRGWVQRCGALDVLAPSVFSLPTHAGDVVRFAGLGAPEAARLLHVLPVEALRDKQNRAPSLGAWLRAAVAHPGELSLHGYLVGPERPDERMSVTAAEVRGHPELLDHDLQPDCGPGCGCRAFWRALRGHYGFDEDPPELGAPDDVHRINAEGDVYLWWS
ncbi:hypothetical protein ACFFKU_14760 [Kineococcus gynurae]|uniref:Uncharacterized protein n=1 Tax=Kineococcus gynurae TaxID=452979 RepID=A0ABV5LTP5_9ACTN